MGIRDRLLRMVKENINKHSEETHIDNYRIYSPIKNISKLSININAYGDTSSIEVAFNSCQGFVDNSVKNYQRFERLIKPHHNTPVWVSRVGVIISDNELYSLINCVGYSEDDVEIIMATIEAYLEILSTSALVGSIIQLNPDTPMKIMDKHLDHTNKLDKLVLQNLITNEISVMDIPWEITKTYK